MAIDTAAKRRSAGCGYGTIPPAADGAIDQGDRQQAAWIYRGILVGAAVVVTTAFYYAEVADLLDYTATVTD